MSVILNAINYFWKLGFNEEVNDIYVKDYGESQKITLNVSKDIIDYGYSITVLDSKLNQFSQKNFIILETVDRILRKGYLPEDIALGSNKSYDLAIRNELEGNFLAFQVMEWEEEYDVEIAVSFF